MHQAHFGIRHLSRARLAPQLVHGFDDVQDAAVGVGEQTAVRVDRQLPAVGDVTRMTLFRPLVGADKQEILDLARATPSPISFFDMLEHVAPMLLLRGTQEAVGYYLQLKAELEERVERGIAAVPDERFRFYWDGPPIWCARGPLTQLFERYHAAVVGSSFGSTFVLSGLDPHDPMESLARAYLGAFPNRSEAYKASWLDDQFKRFRVDAAVFHDCRSAPEASTARYGHSPRLRRLSDVPAFVIEADSHDYRLFSLERLESQLAEFTDQRLPGRCA